MSLTNRWFGWRRRPIWVLYNETLYTVYQQSNKHAQAVEEMDGKKMYEVRI